MEGENEKKEPWWIQPANAPWYHWCKTESVSQERTSFHQEREAEKSSSGRTSRPNIYDLF